MLEKYFNNDFSNFSDVIYYKNDDPMRSMLISLKNNEVSSQKKQEIIGGCERNAFYKVVLSVIFTATWEKS